MKRNLKINGIGVDLVDIHRFDLTKEHFIKRVLTDVEYQEFLKRDYEKRLEYLAGRYACKEAYLKAKGLGLFAIPFREIEILNDESGKPYINDPNALVSLSHDNGMAIAFVIIQ